MTDVDDVINLIESLKDPPPDYIQKNGTFIITIVGLVSACSAAVLTYFLKSRCSEIKCLGLNCKRQVLDLDASDVEITSSQA